MAYVVMAYMVMAYMVMAYIFMAYIVMAHIVMAYIVMAYIVMTYTVIAYIRSQKYFTVTVAYGTCTMPIWLTTTCPKTLIVTLGDELESANAKNHVNLTRSVCARCGDKVLCGAGNAVFERAQMSVCEHA